MKSIFALLATLALASPLYAFHLPASGSGALASELQKMVDLIPLDKVLQITRTYAAQDRQFSTVMSVLKSNEMRQLVQDVEGHPVFHKQVNVVNDLGLDIRSLVNDYNKRMGLAPLASLAASDLALTGGILGYLKDLSDAIPVEQLEELINNEMRTSKVFQQFVSAIASKENADFYWSIYQNPHFLSLKQQATERGVSGLLFQNAFPILAFAVSVV
ncbi:unnamed protein product [Xylocopa violacea]|uniref:Uncharacterized protein n=1 Tax=Xylocopa violacea TaxID=135666 RepID=A0ABP1N4Z1_XYLVO